MPIHDSHLLLLARGEEICRPWVSPTVSLQKMKYPMAGIVTEVEVFASHCHDAVQTIIQPVDPVYVSVHRPNTKVRSTPNNSPYPSSLPISQAGGYLISIAMRQLFHPAGIFCFTSGGGQYLEAYLLVVLCHPSDRPDLMETSHSVMYLACRIARDRPASLWF